MLGNKDAKTIADEHGFHYNTVRNRIHRFGFRKHPKQVAISMQLRYMKKTGYRHPGCHPDTIKKINKARSRYSYKSHLFKSLHELCYALLLDNRNVENWDYEFIHVPYVDRLTGKQRMYYVDFSVQSQDGDEWIEVKPQDNMIPLDKYLYAAQAAKRAGAKFRGQTEEERQLGFKLFLGGYGRDVIDFVNPSILKPETTYTLWFKDINEIGEISHDHYKYEQRVGEYVKCKFVAKAAAKAAARAVHRGACAD